jgi:hypothetical protein
MTALLFLYQLMYFALAEECKAVSKNQPFDAYLVTSGPGDGMYTRVGHSAIWVSGGGRKEVFFNWGAYDSDQENFLWKFFMGSAQYKLTLMSEKRNTKRIKREDQMLRAQHLNLSPIMKEKLQDLLTENAKPENRVYTYHWESQNCATMIRDILDTVTQNGLQPLKEQQREFTKRHEVLRHLGSLHWAWFGWNFMASSYAEQQYNNWEILHIPERLSEEVGKVEIQWEDGTKHKLVDKECILNEGSYGWSPSSPPVRWPLYWTMGSVIGFLFMFTAFHKNRKYQTICAISITAFYLFSGFLGSMFMFFWLTSSLEGYGPNQNWFYASPLNLLMLPFAFQLLKPTPSSSQILNTIPLLLASIVLWGILLDPFSSQINAEFIGLFGLPSIFLALTTFKNKHTFSK